MDGASAVEPVGPGGIYLILAILWVASLVLGAYVAKEKGRTQAEAITLALIFGPFGVLIAALLPTLEREKAEPRREPMPLQSPQKPATATKNPPTITRR
jgi:hypothetical protein